MFLGNPILLLGLTGLCAALVLVPWLLGAKSKESKRAANGVLTLLFVLSTVWILLGGIMGFNHMAVHQGCLDQEKAWAAKTAQGDLSKEDQDAEAQFMATCNTIIQRYAQPKE
jgi:hypothetical protein